MMKRFEEALEHQEYLSECRERATLKRKTDRHLTRVERITILGGG